MDNHDPEFLKKAAEARARIRQTPADTVAAQHAAGAILVDVREPAEHAAGTVPGAQNLPVSALAEHAAAALPDKAAPLITFCNGGNRGALGADALQQLGYTNVSTIAGGYRAYKALTARTLSPAEVKPDAQFILDVRREADHAASTEALPNALWKNPEKIDLWINAIPRTQDVVIYCVRGGGVSNSVVDQLRAAGVKARFIEGGIEAYKAAGGKVVSK
jgi:rhodanese-related sulfurtransferase